MTRDIKKSDYKPWSEKIKKRIIPCLIIISMLLIVSGCANDPPSSSPLSQTYFIFDTVVTVRLYDDKASKQHFDEIENILNTIDSQMNRMKGDSELDRINKAAGIGPVEASAQTIEVVERALDFARQSEGMFEPTIGPLVDLWGIGSEHAGVPEQSDIEQALQLIDYTQVEIDEQHGTIFLKRAGMGLDLGAIAKGYAGDVVADYLRSEQIGGAIIDLGGNIIAMGKKPSGERWIIGIQDPQQQRGGYVGTLSLEERTVVTSGIYERYFYEGDKHYHHILDTQTGYPIDNNLLSVTIITEASIDADALSTTAYTLGLDRGLAFIEAYDATEAIFITKDKEVLITSGLGNDFSLTNSEYVMVEE